MAIVFVHSNDVLKTKKNSDKISENLIKIKDFVTHCTCSFAYSTTYSSTIVSTNTIFSYSFVRMWLIALISLAGSVYRSTAMSHSLYSLYMATNSII